jgi:type IX secretion system PorP/SprF family membrane protein
VKKTLLISLLLIAAIQLAAQNIPIFRQFTANPFLFNPAFAGESKHIDISLCYRKQWLGVNDAPEAEAFTIQHSIKNLSFGATYLFQRAAFLQNSTALGTVAYKVITGPQSTLKFGLSAGVGMYELDIDKTLYSNDPVILSTFSNRTHLSGNFGIIYTIKIFTLGAALPQLFGTDHLDNSQKFRQFRNQLYSLQVKIKTSDRFVVEPYFLYRINADFSNFWEASCKLTFHNKIWTGASFRQFTGLGFFIGFTAAGSIHLNYSYELAPTSTNFANTSSHEIHLALWGDVLFKPKNNNIDR